MDHVRKPYVFSALRVQRGDAATIVQVQVRDEQPQRRTNRFRMNHEFACDSGRGRAGSNANHQAKVGARAGGSAFVEESTHKSKGQAIGGVRQHALVDADALED
jgi:hypothetical protein